MQSTPYPLGPTPVGNGINFSIYAPKAKSVEIYFKNSSEKLLFQNKTDGIWHLFYPYFTLPVKYRYIIDGVSIVDPFSPLLDSSFTWGEVIEDYSLIKNSSFDWEGVSPPKIPKAQLVIYEMHVRGFTQDESANVSHPGTFLGLLEKIPYLLNLGVNAVELLPIHEFQENENLRFNPITKERLYNFWGYSTFHFFGLMNRYGVSDTAKEFKTLVKEFHRFGIEVILDVVYNHSSPKETHPFLTLGEESFYIKEGDAFNNDSGCGNTLNTSHKIVEELVLSSLRYLAQEFHVDGFRFDLATLLKKGSSTLIKAITDDPALKECKLMAEAWDMSSYQVGQFYTVSPRWSEWNDKYRDTMRSFIKGDKGKKGEFATRLCGSQDLFGGWGNPQSSINFINAHDGFTLFDLVSFNQKHNLANGENNRDGLNHNISWNSGHEGPSHNVIINELREKQIKNFFLALFVARGIPMLQMGDEYGHTKMGNNNSWCQDNEISWFDWGLHSERSALVDYVKKLIRLRKQEPCLTETTFLTDQEVEWHGTTPHEPRWDHEDNFIAYTLKSTLWIAFNASPHSTFVTFPAGNWETLIHTGSRFPAPADKQFKMEPFSALLRKRLS